MTMVIEHTDLEVDEDLARRILVKARDIAPCIDSLVKESEQWKDAVAILKGVIAELPAAGSRRTRSISRNGTAVSFADIASAFDDDAASSLRSLCGIRLGNGAPRGSFPTERPLGNAWPREGGYS